MVGMKIDLGGIRALRFTVSERAMWLEDEKTGERIRLGDKPSSAGHLAGMLLGDVLARADAWLVMNGTSGLGLQPMNVIENYGENIIAPWKAALAAKMKERVDLRFRLGDTRRERDRSIHLECRCKTDHEHGVCGEAVHAGYATSKLEDVTCSLCIALLNGNGK